MGIYSVWHKDYPNLMDPDEQDLQMNFPTGYTHVADVEAEDHEQVFELTNHIDSDWTRNVGVSVKRAPGRGFRSTSVGDVIVDFATRRRFAVMGMGCKEF